MVVLHLFGGPHISENGQRREIPEGSKRLVVFVALQRQRIERRYAAGSLWPDSGDARAAGNLRSALWRLRGAGIDILCADKWSLGMAADVAVDADGVTDWAATLLVDPFSGNTPTLPLCWVDALNLLPGWYDDWVLVERERMRQRVLHALEMLASRLVAGGRFPEAVDAALLAVSAEPLRESAQRALIEAHLGEGNLTEARRGYQTYRRLLLRELGVEPSDALRQLALVGHARAVVG